MFKRIIENSLVKRIGSGKAVIITGPRQVGKTTLVKQSLKDKSYLFLDGDDPKTRAELTNPNTEEIRSLIGTHQIVFIDEAQRIENIGLTMKIITDQFKDVQLIASGSSAFELMNKLNEPLTGRKWEYHLFPISYEELESKEGVLNAKKKLENLLLFGMYPDVLNNPGDEREVLTNLTESYLFKDLLSYNGIRKAKVLENLLRALAFQVGNEVSFNELSKLVGVDKNTVASYIKLLEMSYVVFSLSSFSRNLRKEIKHNQKIYFYDNGVRNAIIQNFNPLEFRNDIGALWENFLISERMKLNAYNQTYAKPYFWRTVDQQEIDYIEEKDGVISAFEFKWKAAKNIKTPLAFVKAYNTQTTLIDSENYRKFVLSELTAF
jgi:predicted AAA+ superfamily ATPase